jgi:uncharacterized protein YdcH (DUF465 family)
MATTSNIEIEELKNFINEKFNEFKLELKQDINHLDKKIDVLSEKVNGIDKRISTVETSIQKIPDLAEKVGEFKNWKQIGVLLLASVFSGTIGSFIGWIARSIKP